MAEYIELSFAPELPQGTLASESTTGYFSDVADVSIAHQIDLSQGGKISIRNGSIAVEQRNHGCIIEIPEEDFPSEVITLQELVDDYSLATQAISLMGPSKQQMWLKSTPNAQIKTFAAPLGCEPRPIIIGGHKEHKGDLCIQKKFSISYTDVQNGRQNAVLFSYC